MRNSFLFVLFSLFNLTSIAQNRILDTETKEPVSYAHVKLISSPRGTIADFNGIFSLDSSFSQQDTLTISCIGYESKQVIVKNLNGNKSIELKAIQQLLPEVTISEQRIKYKIKRLGIKRKPGRSYFPDFEGTAKNGEEKAIWFPNEYSINGYLRSINVFVSDLGYPDAHFRVHVYDCDAFAIKPGKELTTSNIITSGTTGNEWVSVDMNKEHIQVGENGCFVSIEWFDSPKSKLHKDTVYKKIRTYRDDKWQDTIYSWERSGDGVVLGAINKTYRYVKNRKWHKKDRRWVNDEVWQEDNFFRTDTLKDGSTFYRTPDNHLSGILCLNIDVAFPKRKIDLDFETTKKRKLNRIEKEKRELYLYPQSSISELFSSLIKAFENDKVIYVLKYLCIYRKGELNEILAELNEDPANILTKQEKAKIITHFKELQTKLSTSSLTKLDNKHFELNVENETYNLVVDDGLWQINPYSYKIYKQ